MEPLEILEIGRELRVKRLIKAVFEEVKRIRPSLNIDTVYRAFNNPECNTELLIAIREAGKQMLNSRPAEQAAAA